MGLLSGTVKKNKWLLIGIAFAIVICLLVIILPILYTDCDALKNCKRKTTAVIVREILREVPLIDGHNDFPMILRDVLKNQLEKQRLDESLLGKKEWDATSSNHVDIPRLREGGLGGQFWSIYSSCEQQFNNSLHQALEQIDVTKRMIDMYSDDFQLASSSEDIWKAFRGGKIASLMGVEGGHVVEESLAVLRILYEVGVRYLTLTHNCDTPWARYHESSEEGGLTDFGKKVIKEMNRLGMLVDLSHVSHQTMRDVLDVSISPVIFSHSSAFTICNSTRNVPDDVLNELVLNGGIVMVNFYPRFIDCSLPPDLPINQNYSSLEQVLAHFNHMKQVMGSANHIGIGSDFSGIEIVTTGLEDVSKYPNILEALLENGWTKSEVKKVAGLNILRVLKDAESVKYDSIFGKGASEDLIPSEDYQEPRVCGSTDMSEKLLEEVM